MAQLGDHSDGIHEVTGSIPVSSTKSSNNLAGRRIGRSADSYHFCPSSPEHAKPRATSWN